MAIFTSWVISIGYNNSGYSRKGKIAYVLIILIVLWNVATDFTAGMVEKRYLSIFEINERGDLVSGTGRLLIMALDLEIFSDNILAGVGPGISAAMRESYGYGRIVAAHSEFTRVLAEHGILGLIGLGRVGSQVAKIAKVFGMEVMAWSENLSLDKCKELGVLPASKEDLIQNSDFVSIHVQGGDRYKDCITLKEFDKMKKSSYLINTSRGPIVNEDDLIIAVSTNVIAGAGIDVYDKEPLPSNHKLRFVPNIFLLPHLGYVTAENYSIFYTQMIENLEACVNGKPLRIIE
mgnify:CR=1 FL=1